jgi:hypothetical protein
MTKDIGTVAGAGRKDVNFNNTPSWPIISQTGMSTAAATIVLSRAGLYPSILPGIDGVKHRITFIK